MTVHPRLVAIIDRIRQVDGQGLAEYALILALIAIISIVALIFLGSQVSDKMSIIGSHLQSVRLGHVDLFFTADSPPESPRAVSVRRPRVTHRAAHHASATRQRPRPNLAGTLRSRMRFPAVSS